MALSWCWYESDTVELGPGDLFGIVRPDIVEPLVSVRATEAMADKSGTRRDRNKGLTGIICRSS